MLGIGVLLLALFVAQEARVTNPLLPLRVLADRNRAASFLAIGISGAAIFGVFLFLTYYLQDLRGFSPIATGLAFLSLSATIMSSEILGQTKLQARFGQRPLVATGMTLGGLGLLYLTRSTHAAGRADRRSAVSGGRRCGSGADGSAVPVPELEPGRPLTGTCVERFPTDRSGTRQYRVRFVSDITVGPRRLARCARDETCNT
jgi:hypothetical protein